MSCRGVRGATTVEANDRNTIIQGTKELLAWMILANDISEADVSAAFFTATPDLNAAFPAAAARRIGWKNVPLFGAQELAVENAPPRCIRILLLWETDRPREEIQHVYLNGATALRPDLPAPAVDREKLKDLIENRTNGGE